MGKAELGEKQICPSCGAKFYDLNKRPAACPKCAHVFDPADEVVKLKRAKATKAPVYEQDFEDEEEDPKRRAAEAEEGFEEEPEETRELDADAVEDAPDLGEDEEEVAANPDALPAGFSEAEEGDIETVSEEGDDGVPLLEDDEEFPDDELGEVEPDEEEDRP